MSRYLQTNYINMSIVPPFALGTWKIPIETTASIVYESIRAGVLAFDCACDYGNEIQVGLGIKRAIDEGVPFTLF
jgi:diketogulonate reductase-like aldo/keto reductase